MLKCTLSNDSLRFLRCHNLGFSRNRYRPLSFLLFTLYSTNASMKWELNSGSRKSHTKCWQSTLNQANYKLGCAKLSASAVLKIQILLIKTIDTKFVLENSHLFYVVLTYKAIKVMKIKMICMKNLFHCKSFHFIIQYSLWMKSNTI